MPAQNPENLEDVFDQITNANTGDNDAVTFGAVLDEMGHRSFGPQLLLAGIIVVSPIIGDIPGVPTAIALFILLTASQILIQREHVWLPDWLLNRSVEQEKLEKVIGWMRPAARFMDRLIKKRLTFLVNGTGAYVTAAVCLMIAAVMPVMEIIPFSANIAGAAITCFGLSLIARDGLLALFAYLFSIGGITLIISQLF